MWFSNAIRNEQIKYMFNNEFDIRNIEFTGYEFHHHSLVTFSFICKNIPSVYPKKWENKGFNSISLILSMASIHSFESRGRKVGFICSPKIDSTHNASSIEIIHSDFHLSCNADFLTIEGITPGIDIRWD
ncbi:Imm50 family immunity protein [Photorhabdus khanii]|uniref:Immunity protein 50 n=1 Tax=Photorhabdus khanii subsp. guanajuatensis TaxID=2100166 RepID=A0A4R4IRA1_9GAMM|nr:Imm50 family immunity protein [Photorhabdus khanii]TDB43186.1 hypothetical protein C5467_23590 [Photorhabdus khanii subsp. guanajuatensis]